MKTLDVQQFNVQELTKQEMIDVTGGCNNPTAPPKINGGVFNFFIDYFLSQLLDGWFGPYGQAFRAGASAGSQLTIGGQYGVR